MAQRVYWSMVTERRDQTIVPLGRSGAGKTTSCQAVLEQLVSKAGCVDSTVTGRGRCGFGVRASVRASVRVGVRVRLTLQSALISPF